MQPEQYQHLAAHFMRHPNGGGRIYGSEAHVSRDTFLSEDSVITGKSVLMHGAVISSFVKDSIIEPNVVIRGTVLDRVVIEHDVELIDVSVGARNCAVRIHEGIWHRAPRYIEICGESAVSGQRLSVGVTECIDGKALIACRCHSIRQWMKAGPRLGRILGWKPEQVEVCRLAFEEWLDCPNP